MDKCDKFDFNVPQRERQTNDSMQIVITKRGNEYKIISMNTKEVVNTYYTHNTDAAIAIITGEMQDLISQ